MTASERASGRAEASIRPPDPAGRAAPGRTANSMRALRERPTRGAAVWNFARRRPIGGVSLVVLAVALVVAAVGPFLGTGDPTATRPTAVFASPSGEVPMGGDYLGRSVLARLVVGLRVSLALASVAALAAAALGTLLGLIAGYAGGAADEAIGRLTDVLFAFPTLLLALLVAMVLGPGIPAMLITIVVATIPIFARVARGPTLAVRATEYAVAALVGGATPGRVLFRHVLPNISTPLLVQLAFTLSGALIAESGLSFLGLGVQPPMPSLGSLLRDGRTYMELAPWTMLFPGVTLAAAILAINLLGDELQAFTDPRLRRR